MEIDSFFFGELRRITGLSKEEISLKEGVKLIDLIDRLSETYGSDFRLHVDRANSYIILVNGRHHDLLGGKETILKGGDTVVFLPITAGG